MNFNQKYAAVISMILSVCTVTIAISVACVYHNIDKVKTDDTLTRWTVLYPDTYKIIDTSIKEEYKKDGITVSLNYTCIDSKKNRVKVSMKKTVKRIPDILDLKPATGSEFSIMEDSYDSRRH